MKNVELELIADGSVALVSQKTNIKVA
jgi:hypothetical protein